MGSGEYGRSVRYDAIQRGETRLVQLRKTGAFGFARLAFHLELLLAFLFLALLLFLVLLSALRVFAFALCSLFLGLLFRGRCHDGGEVGRMFGCGLWIMHRAVGIGADGECGADTFAVDDEGGLGGFAGQGWLRIGVLGDGFDLPDVSELDGSGALLFRAASAILDLDEVGTGGCLAVDMGLDLAVIARGVKALCGIWANSKSFLLARSRPAGRAGQQATQRLLRPECQAGPQSHPRCR